MINDPKKWSNCSDVSNIENGRCRVETGFGFGLDIIIFDNGIAAKRSYNGADVLYPKKDNWPTFGRPILGTS